MKTSVTGYETTAGNAVLLTIAYIGIGMAIPAILNTACWRSFGGKTAPWLNLVTLILVSIGFFVVLAGVTGYKPDIFRNITLTGILLAIGCSLLFFLGLDHFLDPVFDGMFPQSAASYQKNLEILRLSPGAAFVRVCLFAPITEEIIMRGYILTGLQNKYGMVTALMVTTVLFAIFHFNFVQTLSAAICGFVIGVLYIKTGSLFCCVLAHGLYNTVSYFMAVRGR